jgi:hypothetical protein
LEYGASLFRMFGRRIDWEGYKLGNYFDSYGASLFRMFGRRIDWAGYKLGRLDVTRGVGEEWQK